MRLLLRCILPLVLALSVCLSMLEAVPAPEPRKPFLGRVKQLRTAHLAGRWNYHWGASLHALEADASGHHGYNASWRGVWRFDDANVLHVTDWRESHTGLIQDRCGVVSWKVAFRPDADGWYDTRRLEGTALYGDYAPTMILERVRE